MLYEILFINFLLNFSICLVILPIGGIFHADDIDGQQYFQIAVQRQNAINNQFRFQPMVMNITGMDVFEAQRYTCELAEHGVLAIFGPNYDLSAEIVATICNDLGIPHFTSVWQISESGGNPHKKFTRNMFPMADKYARAIGSFVHNYGWNSFAIVYDSSDGLARLQYILQLGAKAKVYRLPADSEDFKPVLKEISRSGETRIIIDCKYKNIIKVLQIASEVNLKEEYVSFFITSIDGHIIEIPDMGLADSNITAIRFIDRDDTEGGNIANDWNYDRYSYPNNLEPDKLKVQAGLMRDALLVFTNSFRNNQYFIRNLRQPNLSCKYKNINSWEDGKLILENIDKYPINGTTGLISFNEFGEREQFHFQVDKLQCEKKKHCRFERIAVWTDDQIILTRNMTEISMQISQTISEKTFVVVTRLGMPFLRKKKPTNPSDLNDHFEGFSKDLMDEISKRLNFKYVFELVKDKSYGNIDKKTEKWNGMVKDILDRKADLAICDLTITYERKTAIDFTSPFMTLGIGILYSKPIKDPPLLFSFMLPLSAEVWGCMSTGFLCIALVFFLISKISHSEWTSPHPCDENPTELENVWGLHNCFWLAVGSIMQQGCDILPKGIPTRLATGLWWFFALIVISSYTANMASFLTLRRMEESIESVEDLAKQNKIKYGLLKGGSTESFFKDSNSPIYQRMWSVMENEDPPVFVSSNDDGVARVIRSRRGFAFFMESSSIDYVTHTKCNLTRIGQLLDSKSYGIGMPMNSPYRSHIDETILKMKEDETIRKLRKKWWETNNIGEINCTLLELEEDEGNESELKMGNVGGIFLVLFIGCGLAFIIGCFEFIWNVKRVSIEEKITPWEAFKKEAIFACKVWLVKKPILLEGSRSIRDSTLSLAPINTDEQVNDV